MSFTASQVERIVECPASGALPKVHTSSDASDRGDVIHAFHSAVFTVGREAALKLVPESERAFCESIDIEQLLMFLDGPEEIIPELSMVYDVATNQAHALGSNLNRAYGVLKPTEIAGSTDITALYPKRRIKVIDLKTGRNPVTPAIRNWQLKTLAVLGARTYGAITVDVAIAYLRDDGSYEFDAARFGSFEIDIFADELKTMLQRVDAAKARYRAGETLDVSKGDWCRYCASFIHCPAQTAIVKAISRELVDVDAGELTPTRAAEEWVKLQYLKRALSNIETVLSDYAKIQPFELPNGNIVREETTIKKYVNGTIALNVLRENYGDGIAAMAVEAKASAASIKRALGSKANDALRLIEEAGGFKPSRSTKVCEVKPKP